MSALTNVPALAEAHMAGDDDQITIEVAPFPADALESAVTTRSLEWFKLAVARRGYEEDEDEDLDDDEFDDDEDFEDDFEDDEDFDFDDDEDFDDEDFDDDFEDEDFEEEDETEDRQRFVVYGRWSARS